MTVPPKRILLVDDDPAGAELTVAALSEFNLEHAVDVAADGEEALDYLHRRGPFARRDNVAPAVVLLDLKMPKIDGHEVLRQIRADLNLQRLPVVVLTSSDQEADVELSAELGSDAYVVKPVNILDFIETIRGLRVFWDVIGHPPPNPGPA